MTRKIDSVTRYARLREAVGNGDVDRRTFFGLLGSAGLTAGLSGGIMSAMATQARAMGTELHFEGWGGVVSEALRKNAFDPYEAATGNKVIDATFGGENEVLTKVKAAGNTDGHNILHSSGITWYKRWVDNGYHVQLNLDNIPNMANVMEAMIEPFRKITPDGLSAVPYDYGTTGIAYNTEHVSKEKAMEMGANLLLDPSLKGKIGGWGGRLGQPGVVWRAAIGSGPEQYPGLGCHLGQGARTSRPRAEILVLGCGTHGSSGQGRDLRDRGLVGTRRRASGAGPSDCLYGPAQRAGLDGDHVRHEGLAHGRGRGAAELHARTGNRHRGGRGPEIPAVA